MNAISKLTRKIYHSIHLEVIGLYYRRLLIKQLFTQKDINDLLNKTAPRFFTTFKWDLLDVIAIAISRLTDPAKSLKKFDNASLEQLIDSLDPNSYSKLIHSLLDIHAQIKTKSSRLENWRKKWAAHRDLGVVQGITSPPPMSMPEVDEVLALFGKFLNEFERVCQDTEPINLYNNPLSSEEFDEVAQLRIHRINYENMMFTDDGKTIVNLIKKASS